jgi:hypothetical protein
MSAAEIRRPIRSLLTHSTWPEAAEVAQALQTETVGGVLLLVGVVVAMVVMGKYPPTRRIRTNSDLPARAALCAPRPAAAFFGRATACSQSVSLLPAPSSSGSWSPVTSRPRGGQCFPWCLRVGRTRHRGTHLPSALRAFLLTLAAIEDLIAIVIIAVVYTSAPGLLNRTTDESMEGSIMGKRIVVLVISVCRCYWALDSRQRFRTTSHRHRRTRPGQHHRRGRRSPTRRWHPDAEPARSEGRSGGRQRFRAGSSGRSPVAHIGMGASSKMSIVKRPLPSARKGWALIRSRASSRLPASTIV